MYKHFILFLKLSNVLNLGNHYFHRNFQISTRETFAMAELSLIGFDVAVGTVESGSRLS